MSFFILLPDGFEVITPAQSREDFEPLLGTAEEVKVGALWGIVPDDLQELPAREHRVIESMWRGLVQYFGDMLARTSHLDQTRSLLDFPIHLQRKWLHFDVTRTYELQTEQADLFDSTADAAGSYLSSNSDGEYVVNQFNLYGTDALARLGVRLRSSMSCDTLVRFETRMSLDVTLNTSSTEGWFLVGYANTSLRTASRYSGLYVAISSAGRLGLLAVSEGSSFTGTLTAGDVIFFLHTETLGDLAGRELSLRMWYDGQTSGLDPTNLALVTIELEDVDTGEVIRQEQALTFVDSGTQVFAPWWADSFCFQSVPLELARLVPDMGPGDYSFRILPGDTLFIDPTLSPMIRHVPILQPNVSNDDEFLRAGLEFELVRDPGGAWAYLRFEDTPAARLWAEASALDGELMSKMFAPLTGVADLLETSDGLKLKTQIIGALYGLVSGPHLGPLAAAIGGLLGAPIAVRPGIVLELVTMGGSTAIVVQEVERERVYPYPLGSELLVEVGDAVDKFQPLVRMPEIHDWISAPTRLAAQVTEEVQKYSTFLTEVPVEYFMAEYNELPTPLTAAIVDTFSFNFSERIRRYLLNAVAVWCGVADLVITIAAKMGEDLELTDDLAFSSRLDGETEYDLATYPRDRTLLTHRDALTGALDPRYNAWGLEYEDGPVDPDAIPPGDLLYNQAEIWVLDSRVSFTATYDLGPGADVTMGVYGDTQTLAYGESHTFEEPDYWDEFIFDVYAEIDLDFSKLSKSGHLGWL